MKTLRILVFVLALTLSFSALPTVGGQLNDEATLPSDPGPHLGWRYEVVYRISDGKILAFSGTPADSPFRHILNEGEALLDITNHHQLAQILVDARKGSLDGWYVDHATLAVKSKAPKPLPVIGTLPASSLLILAMGSASVGFLGLTMVRRRSRS